MTRYTNSLKIRVLELHKKNPKLTAAEIANELGAKLKSVYCATSRYKIKLPSAQANMRDVFMLGHECVRRGLSMKDIERISGA